MKEDFIHPKLGKIIVGDTIVFGEGVFSKEKSRTYRVDKVCDESITVSPCVDKKGSR